MQPVVLLAVAAIVLAVGAVLFHLVGEGPGPEVAVATSTEEGSPLRHTGPAAAQAGKPLRIEATVTGAGHWKLRATYRAAGGSSRPWKVAPMEQEAGGLYVGWIPVKPSMAGGIDYFLELRNGDGRRWTAGSPDAPLHVPLR